MFAYFRRPLVFVAAAFILPISVASQDPQLRVGGDIKPPTRTKYVAPVYPQIARAAGVSGLVVAEVTIGPDGRVVNAKILRSQPLLDAAALEAIRQWEFTPTLLNGAPVSILMTVTVNFTQTVAFEATLERARQLYAAGRYDDAERELEQARALLVQQRSGIAPPPPPPPPNVPTTFAAPPPGASTFDPPVRVGGDIKEPRKIHDVKPVYPADARATGIQGVVILETTIGPDGTVRDAKVLRSVPLLDQAALDAVKQWMFMPTLLNGAPVSVLMTVTVNFTLQ